MKTWVQTIFFVFSFRINIHTLSDWEHLTDETNYIVLSEVNQIPHLWQVWNKTNTSEVALKKKKWNDNASLEKQANPTVKDTRTKSTSVSISTGKSADTPFFAGNAPLLRSEGSPPVTTKKLHGVHW